MNGWTNYATWNVVLWIDNDEGSYRRKVELLKDAPERMIDAIEAKAIAGICLGGPSTPDLDNEPGHRWEDVNWEEIADAWREEKAELES